MKMNLNFYLKRAIKVFFLIPFSFFLFSFFPSYSLSLPLPLPLSAVYLCVWVMGGSMGVMMRKEWVWWWGGEWDFGWVWVYICITYITYVSNAPTMIARHMFHFEIFIQIFVTFLSENLTRILFSVILKTQNF